MYQNNGGAANQYLDQEYKPKNRSEVPPQIEYVADYTTKNEIIS